MRLHAPVVRALLRSALAIVTLLPTVGSVLASSVEGRALAEAAVDLPVSHVEAAGVVHAWSHDSHCGLCAIGSAAGTPTPLPRWSAGVIVQSMAISAALSAPTSRALDRAHGSRAPPTA